MRKMIVIDTETTDLIEKVEDKVDPTNAIVYNVGWKIIDSKGNVYAKHSFIIKEVFFGMKENMRKAFYASKIPQYEEMVANGTCEVTGFWAMRELLIAEMKAFSINVIIAHNARFDVCALNNTLRLLTETIHPHFFPATAEIWDSMKMANSTIAQQKHYKTFCVDNGFMTKHAVPRPRLTAEILYRYLTNDITFEEEHTALADVDIEAYIVVRCFATHKKMNRVLYPAEKEI